ncbi:hypothetical protein A3A64_04525 [Candidatus Gottesmanbacteria bacterium RIFCSPLOWO2_01_FULL_48_11]|uniref:Uncharacterized protein n=1 Tax=Candidatus Gottesmanbacteria bacterium RIFCSPLOWO2_01_FULL_48_11 TaxID=1798395 RepID=A0A1F6ASG0_9BACT|nr:MAG: hypothetical protein A3A64_04525 [Candidatus Gottesmanbacteria bacterium RIFCSPLOWO2_01_FULL_48_11]
MYVAPKTKGVVLDAIQYGAFLVLPHVNGDKELVFRPKEPIVNDFDHLVVRGQDTKNGEEIVLEFRWSPIGNHALPLTTHTDHQ